MIKRLVKKYKKIHSKISAYKNNKLLVPPGHFYSPIPSLEQVKKNEKRIFGPIPRKIPGIDLRENEQLALLNAMVPYYKELPFQPHKTEGLRYYFENHGYSYSDAIYLYCMIRHLKPKKIIEVGSGHSSCVTLDTNELFFNNEISITLIEPYPDLALSLLKEEDKSRIQWIQSNLQDVDLSEFSTLQENDILFIDSTHVVKVDSDVNYIFSKILPSLALGVHIHFHDIFYPFEYPREWIFENKAWNEIYMLRAFLEYNSAFKIVAFNTFMEHFHEDFYRDNMPLCLKNPGGSIWLEKMSDG